MTIDTAKPHSRPAKGWQRLHDALMPDYNAKAATFWWLMLVLGAGCAGHALLWLAQAPARTQLEVVIGVALAMLAGLFPIKIPRTSQSFSAGDLFIYLLLLTHGPAAGAIAAGLETLVSSCRSSVRWTTRLGSPAIAVTVMFGCGSLLHSAIAHPAIAHWDRAALLLAASTLFGMLYLACNALLMSTTARLKRNDRLHLSDLVSAFGWVGGANAGAAAFAALLFLTQQSLGSGVLLAVIPIGALLLSTLHLLSRQQEADEAMRRAAAQALEREAELVAIQAEQREAHLAAQHVMQLQVSERRFHRAFTHASIGMALVAFDGGIRQANPALGHLLGCPDDALAGRRFGDFVCAADLRRLDQSLAQVAQGERLSVEIEVGCLRTDGTPVWASLSCGTFSEPESDQPSLIMQIQDVSARRRAEVELHHRAFHDKLTGLPNRERFFDLLSQAIDDATDRAADPDVKPFAVLFMDFDRFKLINDSKGHSVGDQFLLQAARRLSQCLREGDTLARLGGDEFAILATGLRADANAVDLANRLLEVLREPLNLGNMEIAATASIGITFSSMGYTRPEDMLRDADTAMYRAKAEGKARYALFDVHLHTEANNRLRLESDLRQALAEGAVSVAYQPLYELQHGRRLTGFEALARWTHPELGPISPGTFIPIAEESGLITQLTEFMIQRACQQMREWQSAEAGLAHLSVHVNVAARDIADDGFVGRVRSALLRSGLAAQHLVIELTENILMAQLSAAMGRLTELRELGVGLSVDDFGTGYSSLSHLAVLPIDSLKIDMSFVRHMRVGSKEAAVIRAIVLLGKSLGKEVIAEGIETQSQLDQLRELGCCVGQGYFLSRPLFADAVGALLQRQGTAPVRPPVPDAALGLAAVH